MSYDLETARRVTSAWHVGQTSAHFESGRRGPATISTGRGDHGGVSYGAYQLATHTGTLREYLGQSRYGNEFANLRPGASAFNARWLELARTDPFFGQDQHDFIKRTHYDVQDKRLQDAGIDLSQRGRAVHDALWSTSVQFRRLTPTIFAKGLEEKFGKDYRLASLSDKDIIEAVQDYKHAHNCTLFAKSPSNWPGLLARAESEKAALLTLAAHEHVLKHNGEVPSWAPKDPRQQRAEQHLQGSPLFKDALTHLKAYNAAHHIVSDQRTLQSAAAIAAASASKGLSRIDHVEPNADGSNLIAVQGKPGTAHSKVAEVSTMQALNTPFVASAQAFADAQHAQAASRGHQQRAHQHDQQLAPAR